MASTSYAPDHDPNDTPILIDDLLNMLVIKISPNERPYTASVYTKNNEHLQEWRVRVLEKICDERQRISSVHRAWNSWNLFYEGKSLLKYRELVESGHIVPPSSDVAMKWKEFFETHTIEEMCDYGSGNVSYGWNIIESYLKYHFTSYMIEHFFSKSDDPLWWEVNHPLYKQLQAAAPFPFWSDDVMKLYGQRVITVLKTPVEAKVR